MEDPQDNQSNTSQTSETSADYNSDDHSSGLISNFESFRVLGGYSDITIRVEGREFPCHRVILAAGSPYFKSMFSSGMKECHKNSIDIKQIEANVFEMVLHFVYTGHVQITSTIMFELFRQAHLFQIASLVDLCVNFFKENMRESNVLVALTLGDSHAHRVLYELAKEFACSRFQQVEQDEDFVKLSGECIVDLLSDKRLNCAKEDFVFKAAMKWLDSNEKSKHLRYTLLQCVKFPLISKQYLFDVVSKNHNVLQDEKGLELLDYAFTYHSMPSRIPMLPSYQITPRLSYPQYEAAVLLGGRLSDGLCNDVECYRYDTQLFTSLRQLPFKKRNEFAVCSIGNDIYVSGGLRSAEFWKYESGFDSWVKGANMQHARRRHAMAAVDGMLFVLGGFDEFAVLNSIEMWINTENRWVDAGDLVHPVENMGYIAYGKMVYLFGGKNGEEIVTNLVQCYDTTTKCTTLLSRSLPASDMCLNAAVLNGYIYVVGLEGCFKFSPDLQSWEVLPDQSCPRDFVSLAVLDEKLFAIGGRRRGAKDNLYTNLIECYDPNKNTWEVVDNIPVSMYSYGCVRVLLSKNADFISSKCVQKSCSSSSLAEQPVTT